jgi:adenylate kinase family enzyme
VTQIAVIGNAGGGKSTLCRQLGLAKGLPVYAVDKIQWKPGWVPAPAEEIEQKHGELLSEDRWIIDGWGGWDNIRARFDKADTIIFVDHPLWVHYWWALKRQFMCLFRPRPDGPADCPMLPMTWQLFKMIWAIHRNARPRLMELVENYRQNKKVFHLHSPRELRRFVREHCQAA